MSVVDNALPLGCEISYDMDIRICVSWCIEP